MSAEYVSDTAEISCRKLADNADNLNVAKILEYGDNIENADLVNSHETPGTASRPVVPSCELWCSSRSNKEEKLNVGP